MVGRLWRGELPLSEAFWTWAVIGGLAVNLAVTFASLLLLVGGHTLHALLVGHLIAPPYNILAAVGVWRSALRYEGPRWLADWARWGTAVAMTVLSIV